MPAPFSWLDLGRRLLLSVPAAAAGGALGGFLFLIPGGQVGAWIAMEPEVVLYLTRWGALIGAAPGLLLGVIRGKSPIYKHLTESPSILALLSFVLGGILSVTTWETLIVFAQF
jgi:hypothetical protein